MTSTIKRRIAHIRHGQVPKGYRLTRCGIVPTDWMESCLGDIYAERNEPGNENLPLLMVSIHSGVSDGEVDEEQLPKKVKRIADKTQYKRAASGDLVFNMMRAWQGAIGTVRTEGMVSPAYIVAVPNDKVDPLFMDYYVKMERTIQYIHRQSYGVTDFRLRLYWDSFVSIPCVLPSLAEQRKIAKILATQDRVIELLNRKIEQLKLLKKCYLRKMFPQHGKNKPEVRFSGFTDEWRWRRLGEMGNVFAGLSGKNKEDFGHGNGHYVTYLNVFSNPISDLKMTEAIEVDSSQNSVRYGDIFFTVSSETPEDIGMSSVWLGTMEDTYLNSFCFGYRPKEMFNPHYIANVLRSEIIRRQIVYRAQGISRYNISRNEVMQILIPLPTKAEQVKVGAFFSNVDNQIALHQRKHDEEVLKKKALMQLLLSGIVRV